MDKGVYEGEVAVLVVLGEALASFLSADHGKLFTFGVEAEEGCFVVVDAEGLGEFHYLFD